MCNPVALFSALDTLAYADHPEYDHIAQCVPGYAIMDESSEWYRTEDADILWERASELANQIIEKELYA